MINGLAYNRSKWQWSILADGQVPTRCTPPSLAIVVADPYLNVKPVNRNDCVGLSVAIIIAGIRPVWGWGMAAAFDLKAARVWLRTSAVLAPKKPMRFCGDPCFCFGAALPRLARGTSSRMTVLSVTAGLLAGPSMLVAPCSVMPFVMTRGEVQLASPGETTTVSPSWAEAIADLTSARLGLFASTVPPLAVPGMPKNTQIAAVSPSQWWVICTRFLF